MSNDKPVLRLPVPLRKQKALKAAWKPLLLQWLVPGAGYWVTGEKGRAKVFFGIWALFCVLGALQMQYGAVDGVKGGIFVPVAGSWLPSLGAFATAGIGPVYGAFAWAFGGAGTEPVRTLTQEYGATYVMVAGLLNWLCCFDLWDRITGRWVFRLPKDEQIERASKGE
ncbi:DUF6677 family protein [Geothrix sp. PMB-07]|uniref:DUF6677 family protein n=1 Tax=Geothrix sp. PMB-07 TaxID=3068640 RepID=UPI00274185F4|nr:DUF6677 family protein [Geothrix sp. PMB-07]WLT31393.1 hypothetical protein Q9293_16915 [Geothrix sp. PMB-07]